MEPENAETFLSQLMLDTSFQNNLTSTGDDVEDRRQLKIEKYTRKAIKSMESLMKDLPDDRSRLEFLFSRYEDLFQDLSITKVDLKTDRKEINTLRRIIDERKMEDLRNIEARKRLEILYKDLQGQNKCLKEETLTLHKQEEEKRLHVVDKFQKTLGEVTEIVQENIRKNTKLQQDKIDILNRLTLVDKSCQQREQQVQCLEKQLHLQESLGKAGLLKSRVEIDDIKSAWASEQDKWLKKYKQTTKIRLDDKARINSMQLTLDGYIDKLEALEYRNTFNKEKTEKYKEDLCSVQSENITLLKKIKVYKERFLGHEKKDGEMKGLIKIKETEVKGSLRRMDKLEKMCRKLQLDRALFLKLLQDNHIEAYGDDGDIIADSNISQDN